LRIISLMRNALPTPIQLIARPSLMTTATPDAPLTYRSPMWLNSTRQEASADTSPIARRALQPGVLYPVMSDPERWARFLRDLGQPAAAQRPYRLKPASYTTQWLSHAMAAGW